ncbi:hypothetical protein A1O3_00057 [Capronia epimyces CBS 606.96]|uniref:Myb-like domain-containing protein n=1 Tax=Capronia epimyces CBS 606.96 TaxID=1182542 RepID=W9ZAG5_9EURO|nr:uncharacterized protein A1O3_00057 [Capronia epimyces CBS 606.96]EXJ91509.1 hypothetical protein A1O3_00057 [Capronia epimyces CBS 606.96]
MSRTKKNTPGGGGGGAKNKGVWSWNKMCLLLAHVLHEVQTAPTPEQWTKIAAAVGEGEKACQDKFTMLVTETAKITEEDDTINKARTELHDAINKARTKLLNQLNNARTNGPKKPRKSKQPWRKSKKPRKAKKMSQTVQTTADTNHTVVQAQDGLFVDPNPTASLVDQTHAHIQEPVAETQCTQLSDDDLMDI